jgi:hypothetical protein
MSKNIARCLSLLLAAAFVLSCAPTTVAPELTATAVPTLEPTATAVPPTATPEPTATSTPVPTATRDPKPSVSNLVFADNSGLTGAKGYDATFDYGVQAVYASIDFANLPEKSKLTWVLTRDDYDVLEVGDYLTVTSGSMVKVVLDQPRQLLPGTYGLLVKAGKLAVSGRFTIDGSKAKPGTTLITERFDNNDLKWSTSKSEYGLVKIEGGQLLMSAVKAKSYVTTYFPGDFRDFDVSVNAQRIGGPRDGYYAIYFRYSYGQGYVFEVSDDGYFNVATQTSQAYLPLIEWTRTTAIKSGEVNVLRVVAKGVDFAFYINDQQVATLKNTEFAKGGLSLVTGNFEQAGMRTTFDNILITVPEDSALIIVATQAPAATPKPVGTPVPAATKAVTTAAGSTSMRQAVTRARNSTEALGGALDRLYHGSGTEACGPLLADYAIVAGSPEFDTAGQPGNVQSAYGPYRRAVGLIADKVAPIARVCLSGGGNVGKLDFDLARQVINEAGSLLTQALNLLGQ